jgi:hypothetical protein
MVLRLMKEALAPDLVGRWDREGDADGALARLFGEGVRPLRIQAPLFEALLTGWGRAQGGRHLAESTKRSREAIPSPLPGAREALAVGVAGAGRG